MDIELCPCCGKPKKPKDGRVRRDAGSKSDHAFESSRSLEYDLIKPATDLAKTWQGHRYGLQALKPAIEPIIVFQKPYEDRPVDCIIRTGAGALNIEAARIGTNGELRTFSPTVKRVGGILNKSDELRDPWQTTQGRWPGNLLLHHSPTCLPDECAPGCPVETLAEQSGWLKSGAHKGELDSPKKHGPVYNGGWQKANVNPFESNEGTAARFFFQADWHYEILEQLAQADPIFYTAKASQTERTAGLRVKNNHPTVKSISLTKYLCSLLLPPAAYAPRRILIPFAGVGSEMAGAILAGYEYVLGIEKSQHYSQIGQARLKWWGAWPAWGQTDVDKILASVNPERKETEAGQIAMFEVS